MDPETIEMSGLEFTVEEFDIDFEYDAPRFYDFSRLELDSETLEAELWFDFSGDYPPSPFSLMSNWRNDFLKQFLSNNGDYNSEETRNPTIRSLDVNLDREDKYNGFIYYNETVNNVPSRAAKSKSKSIVSSGSTLTRPTASLLARQNKPLDPYSTQLLRRCQRSLGKVNGKISSLLCSMVQNQDTKRQKLEAGYLRKVSRLDQAPFVHKIPGKEVRVKSSNGRSKLTVPREPNLQTAQRAGRHRTKVNSEPQKNVKLNSTSSKRRPTTNNVLEAYPTSLPKRNTPQPPNFQASHLRATLRSTQRSSSSKNAPTDDSMRENDAIHSRMLRSHYSSKGGKLKGICGTKTNPKAYGSKISPLVPETSCKEELSEAMHIRLENNVLRECENPTETGFGDPTIESFSKLHLNPDTDIDIRTPSKAHNPIADIEMEIKRSESFHENHSTCGTDRKPLVNVNRSLEFCR